MHRSILEQVRQGKFRLGVTRFTVSRDYVAATPREQLTTEIQEMVGASLHAALRLEEELREGLASEARGFAVARGQSLVQSDFGGTPYWWAVEPVKD